MTDRSIIRLARGATLVAAVLALAGSVIFIAIGHGSAWWSNYGAFGALLALFFAVLVWLVVPGQPRNAVLWVFAASSLFLGVWLTGHGLAAVWMSDYPNVADLVLESSALVPAELPSSAAWVLFFAGPAATGGFFLAITFGLLLFPDGRLPTPRWRWLGWLAALGVAISFVGSAWSFRPQHTGVVEEGLLIELGVLVVLVAAAGALYGLFVRFRRGDAETQRQLKWIVWGTAAFLPAVVAASLTARTRYEDLVLIPFMVAAAVFLGSIGVAVGKHELFDIDVVISRTVVVGGLAAFITLVYAVLVGAIGFVLGSGTDAALLLSVAATVVVAIAFQPLRERMQRWANRLVYGERATPYEVLSRFSSRMRGAAVTQDLIPQMARLLTEGTAAAQATVWMQTDDGLQALASWPETDDGEPPLDAADHLAPVEHDGEALGALTVRMPRGEDLTAVERQLVDDLASQAGLVLRNERLIQKLRSSRQRIVAAQDEERRRLERDLHDGAQQQLVALKIKLGMLRIVDDPSRRGELVEVLLGETDDAIDSLRDLARGIYPPTLAQEGLVSALRGQAAKAAVPVRVEASGVGRYSPDVEAAVYFCTLEAMQNIAKYAEATEAALSLVGSNGSLQFAVSDDGRGFDTSTTKRGAGLQHMEDRIEALGGRVEIASVPGGGTTISGVVPAIARTEPDA